MSVKLIYFVRHGETEANAAGIRQGPDGSLTDKGYQQAVATAKRFPAGRGRAQVIISSPYQRTRETTHVLEKELGLPVEFSDLLVERKNPTEIIGKSGKDPQVKHIVDMIDNSFHDDNLRYSDEENFTDLKDRARRTLEFIVARKEKKIIIVTHGIFLKMVVAYMMYGDNLNASLYNELSYFNPIDNAGIAIASYTTRWFSTNEWRLLVWNDLM